MMSREQKATNRAYLKLPRQGEYKRGKQLRVNHITDRVDQLVTEEFYRQPRILAEKWMPIRRIAKAKWL